MDLRDSHEEKLADEHEEAADKNAEDHTLVLTEPVPEREPENEIEEDGQSLMQTVIMIIGAIILIILLVLLARWIYHAVSDNGQPTSGTGSGTGQLPQEQGSSNSQSAGGQPSGNPGSSSSNNKAPSNQNNGKPLTNTGPGNVAAIFAGSTLAAAGLHYIISLRRFNKYGD